MVPCVFQIHGGSERTNGGDQAPSDRHWPRVKLNADSGRKEAEDGKRNKCSNRVKGPRHKALAEAVQLIS
jgi:hypothetical protein